jgi:cytoskeletal protein RodZ
LKVIGIATVAFIGLIVVLVIVAAVSGSKKAVDNANKVNSAASQSGIQSNSLNGSHPPQADINTTATRCTTDSALGFAQANGTLTNHSSKPSNYLITVTFKNAAGVQFADGNAAVQNVAAGGTATWSADSASQAPRGTWTCQVAQVDRLASSP